MSLSVESDDAGDTRRRHVVIGMMVMMIVPMIMIVIMIMIVMRTRIVAGVIGQEMRIDFRDAVEIERAAD